MIRSIEEIERQRRALLVVAAEGSPVPDSVRNGARQLVHALTWVLDDAGPGTRTLEQFNSNSRETTEPYYILAGCCCRREKTFGQSIQDGDCTEDTLPLVCAIGAGLCLCPGRWPHTVPALPDLEPAAGSDLK
jgi:hypothetical protein